MIKRLFLCNFLLAFSVLGNNSQHEIDVINFLAHGILNDLEQNNAASLQLHPQINKDILKNGYLIEKKHWKLDHSTPVRSKYKINKARVSVLISSNRSQYAIQPGPKAVLGRGKLGKVKLAQLLQSGQTPWPENYQNGDFIAIKFQKEAFEESEIEALDRERRLAGSPVHFVNRKGEDTYALPVKLVEGITLWEWLEEQDPEQQWSFDDFFIIGTKIDISLQEQFHKNKMAFQDNSLDNFLVDKNNNFCVVDFGNACLFDGDTNNNIIFKALCDDDSIRMRTGINEFLQEKNYPEQQQNLYWISLFFQAFEHLKRHQDALPFQRTVHDLFDEYNVSWPPLFTAVNKKGDLKRLSDKDIISYCNKYLTSGW